MSNNRFRRIPTYFQILANCEDSKNEDNEAQQVLSDQIKNIEVENMINAKQNGFKPIPEDQGALQEDQVAPQ